MSEARQPTRKPRQRSRCSGCGEPGHYRPTCPGLTKVFIAWLPQDHSGTLDVLMTLTCYYGIRVYMKDALDDRLLLGRTEPPPYFDSTSAALEHMALTPGPDGQCQVDVRLRAALGLDGPWCEYLYGGQAEGLATPWSDRAALVGIGGGVHC